MGVTSYVELHARSAFSFLRGAALPEALAEMCASLDQPGMALLDFDGVYGAPRFHQAMRKQGLSPYLGSEVLCTNGDRYPLLIASRKGYQNLCRMLTRAKLRVGKQQPAMVTLQELEEFAPGLLCLAATPERSKYECLQRIFGSENVYLEIQRHLDRGSEARTRATIELARSLRAPLVASNGAYYAQAAQRELLDVFTCLRHKTTLARAGRLLEPNAERHMKSTAAMNALFADVPDAIARTGEIASRLEFTLADLGYEFPRYPVPDDETQSSFLRKRTEEGARKRYGRDYAKAHAQIEKELALIDKLGFSGYFLIVWDIVRFCQRNGILIQGRGSAANSAVCYSLEITAVDPVGMELLFERFLSENRGEWPDIDLDLPSGTQRERVIQYVYERYGKLGAAMTANVITYRGRSAAREAGKVLGFDEATLAKLAKLVPMWGWNDQSETPTKQFQEAGLDLTDPRVRKFLDLVVALQDYPRHLGQHSGGMVICAGQLDAVVPLEPASMPGRVVVQWDKEDCADLGIIKVDLLGLGMMAVLEESVALIERHYGRKLDLGQLDHNDPQVYDALQRADTIGLFQVESRAQQATLPRLRPERFYDIVVQVAIIRPGPIAGKMASPYLRRRMGREAADPLHPTLEPVLRRTLGVPLFQEQLLRMAMVASSFTGSEAEELRRALGFKRSEKRMRELEVKLRAGMQRNGIIGETQDRIVGSITSFAMYGFPESHAASFALIAYASAYLKVHYLAVFTCAMLNNQPMGFYAPATLVKDAQRHGLRVLPVDINRSRAVCIVEDGDVRLGFNYVRGLRRVTAEELERRQPYTSIADLARRVPLLQKDEMNRLAAMGALNVLDARDRRDALWQSALAVQPVGELLALEPENTIAKPLRPMNVVERLTEDCQAQGMTLGPHPLAYRRAELDRLHVLRSAQLTSIANGRRVRVAGNVIVRQRPGTAKGILFISLEDETGIANVIVMPDVFEAQRTTILHNAWLLVEGLIQNVDRVIHVRAETITALPQVMPVALASHDFH
jgi:error-prone DNA polymerase